jgi:methionyl-tRNA formyltransferase
MSNLSVMILCGRSPRHLYVANRLCEGARPLAIVQETGTHWSAGKIVRTLRRGGLWRKAWRLLRDRRRYTGDAEARFFFSTQPPQIARPDLLVEVPHINHPDVAALADRLQPDFIAVFGTSLIRGPLLSSGRFGIFNLHGGLSPNYRGADCTFWALYNGEPDQVGCTLHRIDDGIDTGKLIAHICPEVGEGDDELTLFWRAVRDSADVYVEMLERLARGERVGEPQREKGRLYQVKDRTWRTERQLAARMRNGLLRGLHLPARVRWFGVAPPNWTATQRYAHHPEREAQ